MSKGSKKSYDMRVYRAGEVGVENPSPLPCPASVMLPFNAPFGSCCREFYTKSRCE